MKKILLSMVVAGIALVNTGCELEDKKKDKIPSHVIAVHRIIDLQEEYQEVTPNSIQKIPKVKTKFVYELDNPEKFTEEDKFLYIFKSPEIHARNIKSIEIVESEFHKKDNPNQGEFLDVYVDLNRQGVMLWEQMSIGYAATKLAFVVDGTYYRAFYPKHKTLNGKRKDKMKFLIGPVTPTVAEDLKRLAPKNYTFFNKGKRNLD